MSAVAAPAANRRSLDASSSFGGMDANRAAARQRRHTPRRSFDLWPMAALLERLDHFGRRRLGGCELHPSWLLDRCSR
jgi:hypothetical protein